MRSGFLSQAENGVLIITLTEAKILDSTVIERLHQQLIDLIGRSPESCVLLECDRVDFMSSSALGMLIRIHKKCGQTKKSLRLCGLVPQLFQVFKITSLDRVFQISDDKATALASFPPRS